MCSSLCPPFSHLPFCAFRFNGTLADLMVVSLLFVERNVSFSPRPRRGMTRNVENSKELLRVDRLKAWELPFSAIVSDSAGYYGLCGLDGKNVIGRSSEYEGGEWEIYQCLPARVLRLNCYPIGHSPAILELQYHHISRSASWKIRLRPFGLTGAQRNSFVAPDFATKNVLLVWGLLPRCRGRKAVL